MRLRLNYKSFLHLFLGPDSCVCVCVVVVVFASRFARLW